MHRAYGYDGSNNTNTKSILVNSTIKKQNASGVIEEDLQPQDASVYTTWDNAYIGTYGLIAVTDISGKSLINEDSQDYVRHVQRGATIRCYATVEANMYFNWIFGANKDYHDTHGGTAGDGRYELRFTFPVNATATGVSCKWYKGEA